MSNKSELRAALKQARLELTDADHTLRSRQIADHLKSVVDWSKVKTLHYFEPLKELLEPDISGFIVWLEDNYPDIHLATSRQIGKSWEIISVSSGEPKEQFDVVLVPMLGFDARLHRIGYGGGYYDKFLAAQTSARKIGVCFEQGRVEKIPVEPHDIALDLVVTEEETFG